MVSGRATSTDTAGNDLASKMCASVNSLLELATELRQALIHRRTPQIWDVLARQEEQAALLENYSRLWDELNRHGPGPRRDDAGAVRQQIAAALARLRQIQQTNSALAQGLLAAVRRALTDGGASPESPRSLYNRRGLPGWSTASRFVCRIG